MKSHVLRLYLRGIVLGVLSLSCAHQSPHPQEVFSREPASVASWCWENLRALVRASPADTFADDASTAALRDKLKKIYEDHRGVNLPDSLAESVLRENFSWKEIEPLFVVKQADGSVKEASPELVSERLTRVSGPRAGYDLYGPLDRKSRESFQKIFADSFDRTLHQKNLDEVFKRKRLYKLDKILSNSKWFRIRSMGDSLEFPNGKTYPVLKRQKDGTLIVGIPSTNLLRTQDYHNPSIEAAYRNDPKLRSMSFEGTWMPDGRVMILDQHHRTTAYKSAIGDPIPFRLKPAADGQYYAESHLFAMKFYTTWMGVGVDDKMRLLEEFESLEGRGASADEQSRWIHEQLESLYHKTLNLQPLR